MMLKMFYFMNLNHLNQMLDNLKDDLSQIYLFYVKLNKDNDRIKIELILSMKEGVTGIVSCKLFNTFNSNFLCIKYIKKN